MKKKALSIKDRNNLSEEEKAYWLSMAFQKNNKKRS